LRAPKLNMSTAALFGAAPAIAEGTARLMFSDPVLAHRHPDQDNFGVSVTDAHGR